MNVENSGTGYPLPTDTAALDRSQSNLALQQLRIEFTTLCTINSPIPFY